MGRLLWSDLASEGHLPLSARSGQRAELSLLRQMAQRGPTLPPRNDRHPTESRPPKLTAGNPSLDVHVLSDLERVVYLDAEISDRAFQLAMAK